MTLRNRLARTFDRLLIRLLSRTRGSAQAIRDITYVREILRFSAIFGVFVLLPMLLLSLLALRSLEAEELSMDARRLARADMISGRVRLELDRIFDDFERRFFVEAERGDLGALALRRRFPALRGVFRIDADGALGFPHRQPTSDDVWAEPSAAWDRLVRAAAQAEAAGDHKGAAAIYTRAIRLSGEPAHVAFAGFAAARASLHAGVTGAEGRLAVIADDAGDLREVHGFRIQDLANLLRAEHGLQVREDPAAVILLRSSVEGALASAWPLGLAADGIIARRALTLLQGRGVDPRWLEKAHNDLDDRLTEAWWSNRVADEVTLVATRPHQPGRFEYAPEERALWGTVQHHEVLWAFAFDADALRDQLAGSIVRATNEVDSELRVTLEHVDDVVAAPLSHRSMAPKLPWLSVSVRIADQEALDAQQWWVRMQRRFVILLSIGAGALGILGAVQLVNRELDTARLKADFAANVSHELRSPITQIRLKGEALQLDLVYDEADRRAHYDAIVSESERLSRLVDNVLDFASIERGLKKYTLRPGDLGDVLRKCADAFRAVATNASMELAVDLPDDLPAVWIDRDAIAQVVTNLLSNAMKYGSDGKWIRLSARADARQVHFAIEDHGIGIAEEDLARIFEHFYRVESADVRRRRGTGIGLTIVRYIVEAHRGAIQVESRLGQGTTFTVSLPIDSPPDAGG